MSTNAGSAVGGETLRGIIDHVRSVFPRYDVGQIVRNTNLHLRDILAMRIWSGTVASGSVEVPAAYSTGTVSLTRGSASVAGTGTAWPATDKASTTLSAAVDETGMQDAAVASLSGIVPGRYVLVDTGGSQEAVFVVSIDPSDPANLTFRASFAKAHSSGAAVTRSSLANQQMRLGVIASASLGGVFYTIAGVASPTSLILEQPWAGPDLAGSYQVSLVYSDLGVRDLRQVLSMVNVQQQIQFRLHVQREILDLEDPHRANEGSGGYTRLLAPFKADPGGSQLFEFWPRPTAATQFPFTYQRTWPALEKDGDQLPNGIPSDIIVKMVMGDAYRWPPHRKYDKGIYYDPRAAGQVEQAAMLQLPQLMAQDDAVSMRDLTYGTAGGYPSHGAAYRQAHDFDAWD